MRGGTNHLLSFENRFRELSTTTSKSPPAKPLKAPSFVGRGPSIKNLFHVGGGSGERPEPRLSSSQSVNNLKDQYSHGNDAETRESPLHDAVRKGLITNSKSLSKLLRKQSINDVDDNLQSALHVASSEGNLGVLKILVKKGGNLNLQDMNGWTPLHCAAANANLKICEFLLETKGVDVTVSTNERTTILHYLVRNAPPEELPLYLRVLNLTLERGIDADVQNKHGETPLHSACLRGNVEAVRFLLDKKAGSNVLTNMGETPLHYAVRSGKLEVVKLLTAHGADPRIASFESGKTPFDVATEYNQMEVLEHLTECTMQLASEDDKDDSETEATPASTPRKPEVPSSRSDTNTKSFSQIVHSSSSETPTLTRTPSFLGISSGSSLLPSMPRLTRSTSARGTASTSSPSSTPRQAAANRIGSPRTASVLYSTPSLPNCKAAISGHTRGGSALPAIPSGFTTSSSSSLRNSDLLIPMYKDGALRKGHLHMFSRGKWNRLWFVVKETILYYFTSPQDAEALGEIDLVLGLPRMIEDQFEGKEHCFELLLLGKTHVLSAETSKDKSEWMELLHVIHEAHNAKKVQVEKASSSKSSSLIVPTIRPTISRSQLSPVALSTLPKLYGVFSSKNPEKDFASYLLDPTFHSVMALSELDPLDEDEEFSRALINFFDAHNRLISLLKAAITQEIRSTTTAATLFRGASMATKLLSIYTFDKAGLDYLRETVSELVNAISLSKSSFEVDPNKAERGVDVKANLEKLLALSQSFLDTIFDSVDLCPLTFRQIFKHAQDEVDTKFPDMHRLVVGGFIFLRFFCPAIVTPEKYHLVSEPPSKEARRGLILVSKLLQNLANGVEFDGSKEEYMKSMNHFVTSNLKGLNIFFDKLTDAESINNKLGGGKSAQFSTDIIDTKSEALQCLFNYFAKKKDVVKDLVDGEEQDQTPPQNSTPPSSQPLLTTISSTPDLSPVIHSASS